MNNLFSSIFSLAFAVLILSISSLVRAQEVVEPSVVVLFGDSISTGFNREANFTINNGNGRGVVELFGSRPVTATDALLNSVEEKRTSTVINWGAGGTTSTDGVRRIPAILELSELFNDGKHYYILIMYGTNDIGSGIASSTTAFNIRQIINQTKAYGANFTPVVSTVTPRNDRAVEPMNSKIVPEVQSDDTSLVDAYEAFASHPSGYTSLLSQERSLLTGQLIRLHPNNAGYDVIAKTWFDEALVNLIEPDFIPPEPVAPVGAYLLLLLSDDEEVMETL